MAAPVAPARPAPERSAVGRPSRSARCARTGGGCHPAISGHRALRFVVYATWAAFQNANYYSKPYISPFYSPCIAHLAVRHAVRASPTLGIFGPWWAISPAILILIFPLGFRLTCYYYRRAYYRSFWLSPPACAVAEPHKRYSGETRFPLILQNIHRYFFYCGLVFNCILTYDAVVAIPQPRRPWGQWASGPWCCVVNAVLLWTYSLSCHSCRHIVGGRLKHFSRHPIRFKVWGFVSKLNAQAHADGLGQPDLRGPHRPLRPPGRQRWITDPRFF